jgi:hypothetical protein
VATATEEREIVRSLPIARLDLDAAAECRDGADEEAIDRYVAAMSEGDVFPPVVVFDDGTAIRLADGRKRVLSAKRIGKDAIRARVYTGGRREAVLYAASANLTHGAVSSRADKRKAVEVVLRVAGDLADREIGRRCGVDHKTVASVRDDLSGSGEIPQIGGPRTVHRNGTSYTQDTSRIGSKPPACTTSAAPPNVQADPPDVAEGRRNGTIPADVDVEVTEPEPDDAEPIEQPAEMTDAEYLDSLPARPHLSELVRKRFDIEALLFRQITPIRLKYASACKAMTNQAKRDAKGHIGPWMSRHFWFLRSNGPGQWAACLECSGTGRVELIGQCAACHAAGYHL